MQMQPTQQKQPNPQIEQVSLNTLQTIFEVDSGRVHLDQLSYGVNYNSVRVDLEAISPEQAVARNDPSLRFLLRAEDGTGWKNWSINAAGQATPTSAHQRDSKLPNPNDMSHLKATTILEYVTDKLGITNQASQ